MTWAGLPPPMGEKDTGFDWLFFLVLTGLLAILICLALVWGPPG